MRRRLSVVAAFFVLGIASTASGQVQTGGILVKAADEQGAVMPGVTVTISRSPCDLFPDLLISL
jgi:hypothetical protein